MRDIGCMVAMVVSSFGLQFHVLQSASCRSFSFPMNEAELCIRQPRAVEYPEP